jgi:trehalose 6-phosphate phosphatase
MISPSLRDALEAIANVEVLVVASDYDGTLSPIVDDPVAAVPNEYALKRLIAISAMPDVHVVVVSGRSQEDLAELTGEPAGIELIGDHGAIHTGRGQATDQDALDQLAADLASVAGHHPNALVERKTHGVALHYRNALDEEAAADEARSVARNHNGRIIEGKKVVEVIMAEGDKGSAIETFRQRCAADAVVFFGDDTTDEDVFRTLQGIDVGVKVGPGPTAATYRVDDTDGVAMSLAFLGDVLRSITE